MYMRPVDGTLKIIVATVSIYKIAFVLAFKYPSKNGNSNSASSEK